MTNKNQKKKLQVYISEKNMALLETAKAQGKVNYSELIDKLLDAYFKRDQMANFDSMTAGLEEKIDKILDATQRIQNTTNATYRASNYTSHLLTIGLAPSTKPSEDAKRIARKKTMRDYSSLRADQLTKEDYLLDLEPSEADDAISTNPNSEKAQQSAHSSIDMNKYFK